MSLVIPPTIISPQDLLSVIEELKNYSRYSVHEAIKQRVTVRKSRPANNVELSDEARDLLRQASDGKTISRRAVDNLIRELDAVIKNSQTVTFTLAAPATTDVKRKLADWCRHNIGPSTLIAFKFNSTLLGGFVVRYGSHVHDWSFRRQILNRSNDFMETLRRV